MYPLIPLNLFKLRKVLQNIIDSNKENKEILLKDYIAEAREKAKIIAYTCDELFKDKLIEGTDFHTFLLAVQNLIEYLNSKYFRDMKIEEEVKRMTKTLYDPIVEQKGIEKERIEIAKNLLKLGVDIDKIIKGTGLSEKEVNELSREINA